MDHYTLTLCFMPYPHSHGDIKSETTQTRLNSILCKNCCNHSINYLIYWMNLFKSRFCTYIYFFSNAIIGRFQLVSPNADSHLKPVVLYIEVYKVQSQITRAHLTKLDHCIRLFAVT
jgi:hypothetical protein